VVDVVDLALEVLDQRQTGVDGAAPRLRDRDAVEQLAAGDAEQVGHRARVPERDQRRVDAVLEHRAVLDQVQPEARLLALGTHARVGQPDRRHQVTVREHRQHTRVDLVGLARQRRQPLDLLRVGDQHLPAELLERVVHEPRPGHRLDHRAHRQPMAGNAAREAVQAVGVRRGGELLEHLALLR
jgi:hypothetical protein